MTLLTTDQLCRALREMVPRSAQVVTQRLVERRSRAVCAVRYGISPEKWDMLFLRSVRDLQRQLGARIPPPNFDIEVREAATLAADLENLLPKVGGLQGARERELAGTPPAPEATGHTAAQFEQALAAEASRLPSGETTIGPLYALATQADDVHRLLAAAEAADEMSPGRARETWLRRIAIVAIIALTAYFWWRQKQHEKPVPYVPYLTQPKKQ